MECIERVKRILQFVYYSLQFIQAFQNESESESEESLPSHKPARRETLEILILVVLSLRITLLWEAALHCN